MPCTFHGLTCVGFTHSHNCRQFDLVFACVVFAKRRLELRDRQGRVINFAGRITTVATDDSATCDWLEEGKDTVTITDDVAYYRFILPEGHTNSDALWGFSLVAYAVSLKGDDRSIRTAGYTSLVERQVAISRQFRVIASFHLSLQHHDGCPLCAHVQMEIEQCVRDAVLWTPDLDAKLVEFVNEWSDDNGRAAADMTAADLRLSAQQLRFKYDVLAEVPVVQLHLRFAVVKLFNYKYVSPRFCCGHTGSPVPSHDVPRLCTFCPCANAVSRDASRCWT
jgi:hypothetical protein